MSFAAAREAGRYPGFRQRIGNSSKHEKSWISADRRGRQPGYEASPERLVIFVAIPDAEAQWNGLIRVTDEAGQDYLYPETNSRRSTEFAPLGTRGLLPGSPFFLQSESLARRKRLCATQGGTALPQKVSRSIYARAFGRDELHDPDRSRVE